jgi:hypothetical protein
MRIEGDLVTVVQQSEDRDIESEMVGGLDAGQRVIIPGTAIVVEVCALNSEATFDFAKASVYDTSLGQSSTCNVALYSQMLPAPQNQNQPMAQQIIKPRPTQTQPQQECFLRDIGQVYRRNSQCCSRKCVGSGWNQKCAA